MLERDQAREQYEHLKRGLKDTTKISSYAYKNQII